MFTYMRFFLCINYSLLTVCVVLCAFFGLYKLTPEREVAPLAPLKKEYKQIEEKWVTAKGILSQAGCGPFSLQESRYCLVLPDLRDQILYYGKNNRPDQVEGATLFFVGLQGVESLVSIEEGTPLYLQYQPAMGLLDQTSTGELAPLWGESEYENQGSYCFSPHNRATALSILLTSVKNSDQVQVELTLVDEEQNRVEGCPELARFRLQAKSVTSHATSAWELGGLRVDSTLLVRQKARFVGEDLFLQLHGGPEYPAARQGIFRLDFLNQETPYNCFLEEGDLLNWENERWHVVEEGDKTENKPLMLVKKINDKMMILELWDEIGSRNLELTLFRIKDHYGLPKVESEFRFVQAKTWSQFIVECRGNKMTLKPGDWLLLTKEGWQIIDSIEKIDDYVMQKSQGPLLVIGKLKKEEGGQVLTGHLFNTTRSEIIDVKLEQKKPTTPNIVKSMRSTNLKPQVTNSKRERYHTRGTFHGK